jgi:ABC-type polysaccharide/polyol phosphate export permease
VILKIAEPAYPLFILLALLPFKWLSQSLLGSMSTMRTNASLVTDVYFPRALLPFADTVTGMAHFIVGLAIVPAFMAVYSIGPSPYLLYLPVVIAAQFLLTLGLAYPMAVWGVYYRNLPGLVANLLRLWLYLSPALWALSRVHNPTHRTLVRLNPLTGIFEGYRGAFGLISRGDGTLGHQAPGWDLAFSAGLGIVALIVGGLYFIRRESQFGKLL